MNRKAVIVSVGIVVVIATAVAIAFSSQQEVQAYGEVTVSGESLPPLPQGEADPAVGTTAPTVNGADWEGSPVEITHNGTPKVIAFLAHWCPHCQREVPVVQEWIDANGMPQEVEILTVATSINPAAPNFPPSSWLQEEGWTIPTIMDDEASTAGNAYGVSSFPFWVVLNGEGQVVGRLAGAIGAPGFEQLLEIARQAG